MLSDRRLTTLLLTVNAVLLALIVLMEISGSGPTAQGQAGAAGGATMAVVTGVPSSNQDEPIFILDSRNETFAVYEFNPGTRKFGLKAVRTYKYDKQVEEYQNERPSVADVRSGRLRTK